MKSTKSGRLVLITLLAMAGIPTWLVAQAQGNSHVRYAIKVLDSLGGTSSAAEGINDRGWIAGDSNLPGDQTEHAVVWYDSAIADLGTLGGLSSWANTVTPNGLVVGGSEIDAIDPLGENWGPNCTPSGCQLERAYVWLDGVMTALPTLGGNNGTTLGFNGAVNNRGQAVGIAETATQDPNCIPPQVLDWEAVVWGPKPREILELPPLAGDSVSGAVSINDRGHVVGGSGPTCESPGTAASLHAVLWRDGSVIDLGSFGGTMNNLGWAINSHDQIAGFSDLPGDQTTHAFLWQKSVMTDLGTLPRDVSSFAFGINERGQIIGQSLDESGNSHSFLWQSGVMTDLNTLTPPLSSLYVIQPFSINSESEIVGQAFDQDSGEVLPVLMIPCDEKHARAGSCDDQAWSGIDTRGPTERPNVILPESVREQLRTHRGFRQFAQLGR